MEPEATQSLESRAQASPARPFLLRALKAELVDHLPAWFVYLEAIGLLHALLANYPAAGFTRLHVGRERFVPTVALPLAWFAGYMVLRIRRTTAAGRWKAYLALAATTVGVPALIVLASRSQPMMRSQLETLFEVSQFAWVALFATQIALARGSASVARFFGVTLLYGMILENTGIAMGFFRETGFHLYLPGLPAPLCTMLGWSVVFYTVVALVEKLAEWIPWLSGGVWRRALLATAAALSLDAQLDPMASMSGTFWHWNPLLAQRFLGVPLINFAAWVGAFLPFTYFLFQLGERRGLSERRRNVALLLRVPVAAALGGGICFGLMAIAEAGFGGPSFHILGSFFARIVGL